MAGTGITVNSVLPGPTRSRGIADSSKRWPSRPAEETGQPLAEFERALFQTMRPTQLLKRFTTSEEIAAMVAYLASPLASVTTGAACAWTAGR